MGQTKVRCGSCGAKNTNPSVDRCRICGGLLPDAELRRKTTATTGDSFKTIVEGEVDTWQDYEAGKFDGAGRSRRPPELPPVFAQTAVPGQDMAPRPTPAPPAATRPSAESEPVAEDGAPENGGRLRRFFR